MAVASLQPPAVVYREEQNFDWRVYALTFLAQIAISLGLYWLYQHGYDPAVEHGMAGIATYLAALAGLAAPALIVVGLLRMTTEVTPTAIGVWFGWVPTYRRIILIGQVQRIEVVTFRPLIDHGGWGIRNGRDGERVLSARGNRGVRLELADGSRLLIGSQKPEMLAVVIERALRPGV